MQIQLNQAEISAAIKQYIEGSGIAIAGRSIDITYSAGRLKNTGLTAAIKISDETDRPLFSASVDVAHVSSLPKPAPSAAVADAPKAMPTVEEKVKAVVDTQALMDGDSGPVAKRTLADSLPKHAPLTPPDDEGKPVAAPAKKGVSLFG